MKVLEVLGVLFVLEHLAVGAMAAWEFVIGPAIWRRRFDRRAEQLADNVHNDPGGAP